MKVLLQRVTRARVLVGEEVVGAIGRGVVVLLGIERGDEAGTTRWYARKLATMRLFPGPDGKLWERTLGEVEGGVLVVSQFTLAARTRKGRRPSFDRAEDPGVAQQLYEVFCAEIEAEGLTVAQGRFGAMMQVELVNDGPVTLLLDGPETDAADR